MTIDHNNPYIYTFACMSTKCSVQIYGGDLLVAQNACKKIEENSNYLEKKYNFYDENSYLNKTINSRNKSKLKIDKQSSIVLKKVKELSQKVNFLFDITVGTYKHCYRSTNVDELQNSLDKLQDKTGFDTWEIEGRYLHFQHKETKMDLGGVIKEYAVDEAVKILKECKISSAIVNFGGDIFALGFKPNGESFAIAIKNPKNKEENLLHVQVKDQALTTSAHYERSYKVGEEEFSHILSKKGNTKGLLSATIISSSVLESGIYSTSFMINTNIHIPDGLKVVLIDDDLKLHQNIM